MALACRETERYELVATIVNALAHHGLAADPDQAMRHLITIIRGAPDMDNSLAWLRGEIGRLTIELDRNRQAPHYSGATRNSPPVINSTDT